MNTDNDDKDILSDSHRSYLIRYMEWENLRQEQVSKLFLASRMNSRVKSLRTSKVVLAAS
jgi:hypothetical protein